MVKTGSGDDDAASHAKGTSSSSKGYSGCQLSSSVRSLATMRRARSGEMLSNTERSESIFIHLASPTHHVDLNVPHRLLRKCVDRVPLTGGQYGRKVVSNALSRSQEIPSADRPASGRPWELQPVCSGPELWSDYCNIERLRTNIGGTTLRQTLLFIEPKKRQQSKPDRRGEGESYSLALSWVLNWVVSPCVHASTE
jgi:hypothetical protein